MLQLNHDHKEHHEAKHGTAVEMLCIMRPHMLQLNHDHEEHHEAKHGTAVGILCIMRPHMVQLNNDHILIIYRKL